MKSNNSEQIRLLVISDLYPPYHRGGYEIMAKLVNDRLANHGFETRILTSDYKINKKVNDGTVYRIFDYDFGRKTTLFKDLRLQITNLALLKEQVKDFDPQLISIWHPTFLSKTVLMYLDSIDIPTVYCLEDYWLMWWYYNRERIGWFNYFEFEDGSGRNILKLLSRVLCAPFAPVTFKPVNVSKAIFVSHVLKQAHLDHPFPVKDCPVIYNGLPLGQYPLIPAPGNSDLKRIIWSGRVADYKGTHIALEAVSVLVNKLDVKNIKLDVFGETEDNHYKERLSSIIRNNRLEPYIEMKGPVPYDQIIQEYKKYDLCLFTSIYPEPFGLVWLEAMASGVPVIGTVTGASREIFIDRENTLVYNEQAPEDLAEKIQLLMTDRNLYQTVQQNAIKLVKERFDIEKTAQDVAKYYKEVLEKELLKNE